LLQRVADTVAGLGAHRMGWRRTALQALAGATARLGRAAAVDGAVAEVVSPVPPQPTQLMLEGRIDGLLQPHEGRSKIKEAPLLVAT